MLLYHGSNLIVGKPRLVEQLRTLDFGKGFYTTSDFEQAVRFSKRVVNRTGGGRAVSVYDFDAKQAEKEVKVVRFDSASVAWLDYVLENRTGRTAKDGADIVIGPVANDDVFGTILLLEDGTINKEQAIIALLNKKLPDQHVFKTKNALSFLKFKEAFYPQGGENG